MKVLASRSRLWLALLVVTITGAVAFTLAPEGEAGASAVLALTAALFILEVGLGIADHVRSLRSLEHY